MNSSFDTPAPAFATVLALGILLLYLNSLPRLRSIRLYIAPRFAKRDVTDIERRDIASLHHDMRATPYQAKRTLAVLSEMFNLAELWGLRPDGSNPCLHVKRYREEPRERFLTQDEFARVGSVRDEIEREGSETRSAVAAIRLLMMTGCRRSEIQTLRWEHVDPEAGELHLPDTKTGARVVPLAPSAVAVQRFSPPCPAIRRIRGSSSARSPDHI